MALPAPARLQALVAAVAQLGRTRAARKVDRQRTASLHRSRCEQAHEQLRKALREARRPDEQFEAELRCDIELRAIYNRIISPETGKVGARSMGLQVAYWRLELSPLVSWVP